MGFMGLTGRQGLSNLPQHPPKSSGQKMEAMNPFAIRTTAVSQLAAVKVPGWPGNLGWLNLWTPKSVGSMALQSEATFCSCTVTSFAAAALHLVAVTYLRPHNTHAALACAGFGISISTDISSHFLFGSIVVFLRKLLDDRKACWHRGWRQQAAGLNEGMSCKDCLSLPRLPKPSSAGLEISRRRRH